MLNFPTGTKYETKCSVTHGIMGHLDPKQPPVKRKPFATILNQRFVQKLELILPAEIYEIIEKDLELEHMKPVYSRIILPLKALVEGEFFNEYIKRGNVLMLSEGRVDVDNVYSLREGVLTLHLDKESYERAGIVGKPAGVKGKRGTKPRWVVEINLRQSSMLHGKKGFDRIVHAFKNALTIPVTWLFVDLGTEAPKPDPLAAHFPVKKHVTLETESLQVKTPVLTPPAETNSSYADDFEDYAVEIHEWMSLIQLSSPRIDPSDKLDPFLSRYSPGDNLSNSSLVKITWRGFLSPTWAHQTFVQMVLAAPKDAWFVCSVASFVEGSLENCKDCTILKLPDAPNEYVLWEMA